jgi:hypothetical protein
MNIFMEMLDIRSAQGKLLFLERRQTFGITLPAGSHISNSLHSLIET